MNPLWGIIKKVGSSQHPWIIAVEDTAVVIGLVLCNEGFLATAAYLACCGTRFHTISELLEVAELLARPKPGVLDMCNARTLGMQTLNWKYMAGNWHSYVKIRKELLLSDKPEIQAAFLCGGLLWCLTLEHLHLDIVLGGPHKISHLYGMGFRIARSMLHLVDNCLSDSQIRLICRTYFEFTGHKGKFDNNGQHRSKSWWPHPNIWDNYTHNVGWWTPAAKKW